jgi:FkbM family methyltransferase
MKLKKYFKILLAFFLKNASDFTIKSNGNIISIPTDMSWAFENGEYYEYNVIYFLDILFSKYKEPIFFDIGANYGYYTVKYAELCKKVLSFEPVNQTYSVLASNIKRNKLQNVMAYKLGISDKKQDCMINLYSSSGNNSIFDRDIPSEHPCKKIGTQHISLLSLDEFIQQNPAIYPDIIKIDVEGSELNVLSGAKDTILKHSPVIVIEYSQNTSYDAGYQREELIENLKMFSYTIYGIPEDPNEYRLIPEMEFQSEKISNLIALPIKIKI